MNFSWQRTTAGSWLMEQWVNGVRGWKQETAYVDRFIDFAKGAAGDPVVVFQKAVDAAPCLIDVSLAFGGAPFGIVDRSLTTSSFQLVRFRLWDRVHSPYNSRGAGFKTPTIRKRLRAADRHALDAAIAANEAPRAPRRSRGLILTIPGGGHRRLMDDRGALTAAGT